MYKRIAQIAGLGWMAMLVFLTVLSVCADSMVCRNAYTETHVEWDELSAALSDPINDFSGPWETDGDAGLLRREASLTVGPEKKSAGVMSTQLQTSGAMGYTVFYYNDSFAVEDASSLSFGIYVLNAMEGKPAVGAGAVYTVTVTLLAGEREHTATAYVTGGNWTLLHCTLPNGVETITRLSLHFSYAAENAPSKIQLFSPARSQKNCAFVEHFSAENVEFTTGAGSRYTNALQIRPDTAGNAVVQGDFRQSRVLPESAARRILAVTLSGCRDGGSLSAAITYQSTPDEPVYTAELSVGAGTETYYFLIPEPPTADAAPGYRTSADAITTYALYFRNVAGEAKNGFRITGVTVYESAIPVWTQAEAGSVSALTLTDTELLCTGRLQRDAVVTYIDNRLTLFALPIDTAMKDAIPLDSVRISSNFSFSVPRAKVESLTQTCRFFVAITETDSADSTGGTDSQTAGTEDGEALRLLLPLSAPQYCSSTASQERNLSILGLHGASSVGIFESNVSHTIVDVDLAALLPTDGSGRSSCSRNGKSYALSSAVLEELDTLIPFFTNAGVEVSLRLYSTEPREDFTFLDTAALSYLPSADTPASLNQYAAVLTYLCRRYPEIASITLGFGVNCERYTGADLTDPMAYMASIARLYALTYRIACVENAEISVILPLSDTYIYEEERTFSSRRLSPEGALVFFSDSLSRLGNLSYTVSYRFESDYDYASVTGETDTVRQFLAQNRLNQPSAQSFLWEPEQCVRMLQTPYSFADRYALLCERLRVLHPHALILSFSRLSGGGIQESMYSDIKRIEDTGSRRQVTDFAAVTEAHPYENQYLLWDFSSAYSAQGWMKGGEISSLYTEYSPLFSAGNDYRRVLRTTVSLDAADDAHTGAMGGVLLRNFYGTLNLSAIDALSFRFSLSRPATVIFLVGAEEWRAEYRLSVSEAGEEITAWCDLRSYTGSAKTGYIGILLYGEEDFTLDLAEVYAYSDQLSAETMETLFHPLPQTVQSSHSTEAFYILLILGVLSVCILILLVRRDREEADE